MATTQIDEHNRTSDMVKNPSILELGPGGPRPITFAP